MNMRQKLRCILTIMGIITVCTACIVQKDPVDNSDDSGTKKKSFGKYDIMKGWSESDYSRDEKYVYVKKGTDNKDEFNNFVVGSGESDYSEEEYEQFEKGEIEAYSEILTDIELLTIDAFVEKYLCILKKVSEKLDNEHNLGDNEQERMSGYNNAIVFVLSLINPIYEYELE